MILEIRETRYDENRSGGVQKSLLIMADWNVTKQQPHKNPYHKAVSSAGGLTCTFSPQSLPPHQVIV